LTTREEVLTYWLIALFMLPFNILMDSAAGVGVVGKFVVSQASNLNIDVNLGAVSVVMGSQLVFLP
jgi:hypothetical protein